MNSIYRELEGLIEKTSRCCNGHCFRRLLDNHTELPAIVNENERRLIEILGDFDSMGRDLRKCLRLWFEMGSEYGEMSLEKFLETVR